MNWFFSHYGNYAYLNLALKYESENFIITFFYILSIMFAGTNDDDGEVEDEKKWTLYFQVELFLRPINLSIKNT